MAMKKVLITGGSGTVGVAFIKTFYDRYQFFSYSRNETKQAALKVDFPRINLVAGSIEDKAALITVFTAIKPDIVIHAAALKRMDVAELHPMEAIKINVLGSLNVIDASRVANVSITVGVSSDKACLACNVYGRTKKLMENMFLEANNEKNKFICCRLSNVAGSQGSVISFWKNLAEKKESLRITDPKMNRFMLSFKETAYLLQKAIDIVNQEDCGGILLRKTKAVNMLDLAQCISTQIEIVGKRPGETLDESLVSENELPFTHWDQDYVLIGASENTLKENRLTQSLNTLHAEKMSSAEIQHLLSESDAL